MSANNAAREQQTAPLCHSLPHNLSAADMVLLVKVGLFMQVVTTPLIASTRRVGLGVLHLWESMANTLRVHMPGHVGRVVPGQSLPESHLGPGAWIMALTQTVELRIVHRRRHRHQPALHHLPRHLIYRRRSHHRPQLRHRRGLQASCCLIRMDSVSSRCCSRAVFASAGRKFVMRSSRLKDPVVGGRLAAPCRSTNWRALQRMNHRDRFLVAPPPLSVRKADLRIAEIATHIPDGPGAAASPPMGVPCAPTDDLVLCHVNKDLQEDPKRLIYLLRTQVTRRDERNGVEPKAARAPAPRALPRPHGLTLS